MPYANPGKGTKAPPQLPSIDPLPKFRLPVVTELITEPKEGVLESLEAPGRLPFSSLMTALSELHRLSHEVGPVQTSLARSMMEETASNLPR